MVAAWVRDKKNYGYAHNLFYKRQLWEDFLSLFESEKKKLLGRYIFCAPRAALLYVETWSLIKAGLEAWRSNIQTQKHLEEQNNQH